MAVGALLRLALAFGWYRRQGFAGDLASFAGWARSLGDHGFAHFYATNPAANYPPAYLYVLWAIARVSTPLGHLLGVSADAALADLLKLPAVAADVAIGWLLYRAGTRWKGATVGLVAAGLYLLVPVTWYDSAIWGQVDAVAAAVVLAALVALVEERSELALVLAAVAVLVKPQSLVGIAVVAAVLIRRHLLVRSARPVRLVRAAAATAIVSLAIILPFDLEHFASGRIASVPVLGAIAGLEGLIRGLSTQYSVLTANAYNVWALAGPQPLVRTIASGGTVWTSDAIHVLGLKASTLGTLALVLVVAVVIVGLLRREDPMRIYLGYTVVAYAFYAAPTRVHERYLLPVFTTGALLAAPALAAVLAYVVAAVLNTINLHAVLAGPMRFGGVGTGAGNGFGGGFGRGTIRNAQLPLSGFARDHGVAVLVSLGQTAIGLALLAIWCVVAFGTKMGGDQQ